MVARLGAASGYAAALAASRASALERSARARVARRRCDRRHCALLLDRLAAARVAANGSRDAGRLGDLGRARAADAASRFGTEPASCSTREVACATPPASASRRATSTSMAKATSRSCTIPRAPSASMRRGSVTEDLGTRFVVRAYPELRHVDVAVAEGHVSLRRDGASARSTVGAGQRGRVESDGSVRVVDDVDVERWFDWTRGGLLLDDVTLRLAATEIGRRFGVRVDIADSKLAASACIGALSQRDASARARRYLRDGWRALDARRRSRSPREGPLMHKRPRRAPVASPAQRWASRSC